MFTEFRPAAEELATNPAMWAANFRNSRPLSLRSWLSIRFDSNLKLLRRYLPPPKRILDAGCGFGEWVEFLSRYGYDSCGLDYSDELIARLRDTYPQRQWIHGAIQQIPLADGSVDGVISWGVIEHDPAGPEAALREFHRVLVSGGRIVVTVPADHERLRAASRSQFPEGNRFFQFFFTPEELAQRLLACGFSVLECGHSPENSPVLVAPAFASNPLVRLACRLLPRMEDCNGMIYAVAEKRHVSRINVA